MNDEDVQEVYESIQTISRIADCSAGDILDGLHFSDLVNHELHSRIEELLSAV